MNDEQTEKLPLNVDSGDDYEDFVVTYINDISKNIRTGWFGLTAVLVFVAIGLSAHQDANFFVDRFQTELPLIQVPVKAIDFFLVSQIFVASLFCYLQLNLFHLWDVLAKAPARIKGGLLSERIMPTMLAQGGLWYRQWRQNHHGDGRAEACHSGDHIGLLSIFISLIMIWLFPLTILFTIWWRIAVTHDVYLTLFMALCLVAATAFGLESVRRAHVRLVNPGPAAAPMRLLQSTWSRLALTIGLVLAVTLSFVRTLGPVDHWLFARADLASAELTERPDDWQPTEDWIAEYRAQWYQNMEPMLRVEWLRDNPDARDLDGDRPEYALAVEQAVERAAWAAYDRYLASLNAPDLTGVDLRGADLTEAFLPGARFGCDGLISDEASREGCQPANLSRANFSSANLQGVFLSRAQLTEVNFSEANLYRASLSHAKMIRAQLQFARIVGVDLSFANLAGAEIGCLGSLSDIVCPQTTIERSVFTNVDLRNANIHGVLFLDTNMNATSIEAIGCYLSELKNVTAYGGDISCALPQHIVNVFGDSGTFMPTNYSSNDTGELEQPVALSCIKKPRLLLGFEAIFPNGLDRGVYLDEAGNWRCEWAPQAPTGRRFVNCAEPGSVAHIPAETASSNEKRCFQYVKE